MYITILQQKSMMSSDTPKSISEIILDFFFRQMLRPSLLPKGFFHSLVQNIFCPLENQIRIQHLCIRELNSLEYHGDISSFFRSRGCQSVVRNTYSLLCIQADMEFVQNFTPPNFQANNFTPSISPDFNSFSGKKHTKVSENGEIYTGGKNFTLPPAVTAVTNSNSGFLWSKPSNY